MNGNPQLISNHNELTEKTPQCMKIPLIEDFSIKIYHDFKISVQINNFNDFYLFWLHQTIQVEALNLTNSNPECICHLLHRKRSY